MPARAVTPSLTMLFSAGYLAPYLLPTLVGRLTADYRLAPTAAGAIGSALLLSSAAAGFALSSRKSVSGAVRRARAGLSLHVLGFALAAAAPAGALPLLVLGCLLGGAGSGTVAAVAATGIAGERDPHRTSVCGLLLTSGVAGALYLILPQLGGGHWLPFACIAGWGALALPGAGALSGTGIGEATASALVPLSPAGPLPARAAGATLACCILLWSMAQNALWGMSARIGLERAGLSESLLGLVFALALGAGLLGTAAAGSLGNRLGRALPIGAGTVAIAGCVALSGGAHSAAPFAFGEIAWNAVYPFVLSYLFGLAARLDGQGRWAVLIGSASALGVACGPLAGTLLSVRLGFTVTGLVLGAALLLVALPMAVVARQDRNQGSGEPVRARSARRDQQMTTAWSRAA